MKNIILKYLVCCLAFVMLVACGSVRKDLSGEASSPAEKEIELDGYLMDVRDGHIYRTVKIGDQIWMAENLNYNVKGSECLDGNDSNCVKYGRLYSWYEATDCFEGHCNLTYPVRGACPEGFHLPTIDEWKAFLSVTHVDSMSAPLKSRTGWDSWGCNGEDCFMMDENGTDDYGFAVLPSNGWRHGRSADFWSSSDIFYQIKAYSLHIDDRIFVSGSMMFQSLSIRCVKDDSWSNSTRPKIGSMTDPRDGQTYKTVRIGSQTWMAENLNYETEDSYCWWGWSDSVCTEYGQGPCIKYGRIYSWNDAKDACPPGWHLPTPMEWYALFSEVGGLQAASRTLKSTSGWADGENGTDDFGFTVMATPRTYRGTDKNGFPVIGIYNYDVAASFWTSAELDSGRAYKVCFDEDMVNVDSKTALESSIRCVKDEQVRNVVTPATMLELDSNRVLPKSHLTGAKLDSMTDSRDGQKYRTVRIGSQTWMAENLNFETEDSYCYGNDSSKCAKYGRYYKGNIAMEICPVGWHLPTLMEWEQLFFAVGGQFTAGNKLRSTAGWNDGKNGTDDYGFSAYPMGYLTSEEKIFGADSRASFWSYTVVGDKLVHSVELKSDDANVFVNGYEAEVIKNYALSVRCVKD